MNKLSKGEDSNIIKIKTCVLKVNIHCEGCEKKVKKLLQKINGVYTIAIDTEQRKVTVTGNVDSSTLIKKLRKSGKYAELWSSKKNSNIVPHHHLAKLPINTTKGQKTSTNSKIKNQKMQQLQKELMKMKFPFKKDEKSVKSSAPHQNSDNGSEFTDSFDDEDDYFDETDTSNDETDDDYKKSRTKVTVTAKKGFGSEVHSKGNGGGGTHHEAKNGSNYRSNNNGVGHNNGHKQSNGGMAAAAPAVFGEGSVNPYQQQNATEMMAQQRRMMMMNGYPMAYGYPMPDSNSYTSYFSDENASGSCIIM